MKAIEQQPNHEETLRTDSLNQSHAFSPVGSQGTRKKFATRVAFVVAAMLLVFCIFEAAARVLVVAFNPAESVTQFYDHKFYLAQKPPVDNRPSVLFIGTSAGSYGIYSDLIAQELRKHGYDLDVRNLCSVYCGPSERMLLLQTAMRAGAKPLMVVCDVDTLDLFSFWQQHSGSWREELFANTTTGLLYGHRDTSLKSTIKRALANKCYLFTYRSFIQTFLLNCTALVAHPEKRYDGVGFMDDRIMSGSQAEIPTISSAGWSPNPLVLDERTLNSLDNRRPKWWLNLTGRQNQSWFSLSMEQPMIDFCAKEHIPLVYLLEPLYPLTDGEKRVFAAERMVTLEQLSDRLKMALDQIPNTYFWDFHNADADSMHFADVGHLNPAGAISLSSRLVKSFLSPPYARMLEPGRLQSLRR